MDISSPPKTRSGTMTNLSSMIGPGKDFVPSEVPTLRSVIRKGILIQEENIHNDIGRNITPIADISTTLASLVIQQWQKSNPNFKEPIIVTKKYLSKFIRDK